jgi:hypothetical protein
MDRHHPARILKHQAFEGISLSPHKVLEDAASTHPKAESRSQTKSPAVLVIRKNLVGKLSSALSSTTTAAC